MTDFVLVHGGMHDSWCWTLLRQELARRGHRSWAADLPCSDPLAGCDTYAQVVAKDCADAGANAVVVGHSLGGLTIPLVAALRPVARLVFLSAGVPEPGTSFSEQLIRYGAAPDPFPPLDDQGQLMYDDDTAKNVFYHDCPPEVADQAVGRLRPQALLPMTQPTPLESWPDVELRHIHGRHDRLIPQRYAEMMARRHGAGLELLDGGHSLFLSRPGCIADLLERT